MNYHLRQIMNRLLKKRYNTRQDCNTLASILEDRLADLLVHHTIKTVDDFIDIVYEDIEKDKEMRQNVLGR